MLADTWRELRDTLAPVTVDKSEQEHRIALLGGGTLECWSLNSPDAGRGRKYAALVVDEAALVPKLEEAWSQALRPTLTDLRGAAWFLSTPKGVTNYFHTLYQRGQDPEREDWGSWRMPTRTNPFIDPEEIAAAREDMPELAFLQEYEAEFVSWMGQVFRRILDAASGPERALSGVRIIGVDWARAAAGDFTVFVDSRYRRPGVGD